MDNLLTGTALGRGLHMAHLNVRSLLGGQKSDLIRTQIANSELDIFTLSETWLTEAIPDTVIQIPGFTTARLDRSWRDPGMVNAKKGGGLICYSRNSTNCSDTRYQDLNISCRDLEMQWISVSMYKVRPIVVINVYRPPHGDYKKCCSMIMDAFMKAELKDYTDIFLMGDFNINLEDKTEPCSEELSFVTGALGLKQLINSPTRISVREGVISKTRIDLIFSNSDCVKRAEVLDLNLSDHLAVMVTRKKDKTRHEQVDFKGRSYKNYVKEDFQEALLGKDWDQFFYERDPNILWDIMERFVEEEIERMCPLKSFKARKAKEPWITNEALEYIRDKDKALKKARRTGKAEDWEVARRERNRIGRDLELLRADYLKNQQEIYKGDPKKFWRSIQSVIPSKKAKGGSIVLKDSNNGLEINADEVPGYINEFFTNIGPNLAKSHKEAWIYYGKVNQNSIGDPIVRQEEVLTLCKGINTMKSSGFDKISSRVCKDAFLVLVDKLVHLFNCSLELAIFPSKWKSAKIVPLFKGGDKEEVSNYRPVSLLPLPGKIMEKIVHNRITNFLEENKFLSNYQGGFRKGFSTTATIADLTDDLYLNVNKGLTTLASFIDLKKAFDTVNLDILSQKLDKAGIRGRMLSWCSNYLSNRSQCTVANGKTSVALSVKCGVPQGSVLGPLFFLVYVNDLEEALDDCKVKLYADDTVLYQDGVSCQQAEMQLQGSLNKFSKWCAGNALTINVKKTKLMAFGSRSRVKRCKNARVTLNGGKLQLVPSFKYLGVTVDPTLNFGNHIASVIKNVQHKILLLGKIKRYLRNEVALKIYKAMILPYIDYADVVYNRARAADLDKLQRLQNRCLKLCSGRDRLFDTDRVHKSTNTPFLVDRRKAHTLNFMYKRKDRRPELLNRREIRTRAHDAPLFETVVPRCEAFKRSVGYQGAVTWNNLDPNVRNTATLIQFKTLQKKLMLDPLALIV